LSEYTSVTTAAPQLEIREETDLVEAWRAEQLEMAGCPADIAAQILL
jgi:hypothetical protein